MAQLCSVAHSVLALAFNPCMSSSVGVKPRSNVSRGWEKLRLVQATCAIFEALWVISIFHFLSILNAVFFPSFGAFSEPSTGTFLLVDLSHLIFSRCTVSMFWGLDQSEFSDIFGTPIHWIKPSWQIVWTLIFLNSGGHQRLSSECHHRDRIPNRRGQAPGVPSHLGLASCPPTPGFRCLFGLQLASSSSLCSWKTMLNHASADTAIFSWACQLPVLITQQKSLTTATFGREYPHLSSRRVHGAVVLLSIGLHWPLVSTCRYPNCWSPLLGWDDVEMIWIDDCCSCYRLTPMTIKISLIRVGYYSYRLSIASPIFQCPPRLPSELLWFDLSHCCASASFEYFCTTCFFASHRPLGRRATNVQSHGCMCCDPEVMAMNVGVICGMVAAVGLGALVVQAALITGGLWWWGAVFGLGLG